MIQTVLVQALILVLWIYGALLLVSTCILLLCDTDSGGASSYPGGVDIQGSLACVYMYIITL